MAEYALGQGQPGRHQEGGPVDRVEAHDVLADHVQVHRPEAGIRVRRIGEAGHAEIVREGVDPDIHDVAGMLRHRHAPIEIGAADREVVQPRGTKLATSFFRVSGPMK